MESRYKAITVFCSASGSTSSVHRGPMREVGEELAKRGITMVFGGGNEGMMGRVLEGVKNKDGNVLGIITRKLLPLELKDPSVYKEGELMVVETMSERKHYLFEKCDAIFVGPGGWGTIDEISEFAVTVQIGDLPRKPMIFLNFNDFWKPMKEMVLNMLQEGTLDKDKVDFIEFADTLEEAFEELDKVQARIDARVLREKAYRMVNAEKNEN